MEKLGRIYSWIFSHSMKLEKLEISYGMDSGKSEKSYNWTEPKIKMEG